MSTRVNLQPHKDGGNCARIVSGSYSIHPVDPSDTTPLTEPPYAVIPVDGSDHLEIKQTSDPPQVSFFNVR